MRNTVNIPTWIRLRKVLDKNVEQASISEWKIIKISPLPKLILICCRLYNRKARIRPNKDKDKPKTVFKFKCFFNKMDVIAVKK